MLPKSYHLHEDEKEKVTAFRQHQLTVLLSRCPTVPNANKGFPLTLVQVDVYSTILSNVFHFSNILSGKDDTQRKRDKGCVYKDEIHLTLKFNPG